jgi:uncharacterized membrane protein YvbJ
MSLISCAECHHEISSNAFACPQCGNPINAKNDIQATGAPLITMQATAKKFKAHKLIAIALMLISLVTIAISPSGGAFATLLFIASLLWYIVTTARRWWHHG